MQQKTTLTFIAILLLLLFCNFNVLAQTMPVRKPIPASSIPIKPSAVGDFISVNNATYTQSSYTISQLVNNVLISGGTNCTSSNATNVAVSPNLAATQNDRSWGYFKKENSAFPFDAGIVLSTGFARKAGNVYDSMVLSDFLPTLGDVDLATVLNVPNTSLTNASYIEFDFVAISDRITFNYILASEEYNKGYECDFTDAFALLLKKAGASNYTNLAVLPNGGGVVSTSNIHPAVNSSLANCQAVNQQFFAGYNTTNSDTNFEGRTVPLTATATVIPGATYHFKMVIADYYDHKFDSAVFLEAGSFDIGVKITDGQGTILSDKVKMCNNAQVLAANVQAPNASFKWYFNNAVISGANTNTYTATQQGTYKVEVMIAGSTCVNSASILVENGTAPSVSLTDTTGAALPGTVSYCNTVNQILKAVTTASDAEFEWYLNGVLIPGAATDTYTVTQAGKFTVKITSSSYDCAAEETIDINVVSNPVVKDAVISMCSETNDALFDLTSAQTQITTTPGVSFKYFENQADALAGNNVISNPTAYLSGIKTVYSVVKLGQCSLIVKIDLYLDKVIPPVITASSTILCPNGTVTLTSDFVNGNTWSTGATTQSITVSAVGKYTLIHDDGNCISNPVEMNIVAETDPDIQITGSLSFCDGTSTVLTASAKGTGNTFVWSDGTQGPTLTTSDGGTFTVSVLTPNGCTFTKTVVITKNPSPVVQNAVLTGCSPIASATFDLTAAQPHISTTPGVTFVYYTTLSDAQAANANFISSPSSYNSVAKTLYVLVKLGTCSKIAELELKTILAASVTTQPVDRLACIGNDAVFSVGAINTVGYQWQVDTGSGFTNLTNNAVYSGVTTTTLTVSNVTTAQNGYKFRVLLEGNCLLKVQSVIVTLTVPKLEAVITSKDISCFGAGNGTVSVAVSGGTAPYIFAWSNGGATASLDQLNTGTYTVLITDANNCSVSKAVTIKEPAELTMSIAKENVSCNGNSDGTISIVPSGGIAPYSIYWKHDKSTSTSISGLKTGVYEVDVTDANGCVRTEQVTISEPMTLAASIDKTDVSCNGGTDGEAVVIISGGTAPYTSVWSNGVTSEKAGQLNAGTYSVMVKDANGCTVSKNVVISEPAGLEVSFTQTKAGCGGALSDAVIAKVKGGIPPYSFEWSDGSLGARLENFTSATYTVKITDANGCTLSKTMDVEVIEDLSIDFAQKNVSCNGGSDGILQALISGGRGVYQYKWSTGALTDKIEHLKAGSYSLTVIDDLGCTAIANVVITEPAVLSAMATQTNVNCFTGADGTISLNVTGGTQPYQYKWSNGSVVPTVNQLKAGLYNVTVQDANGCNVTLSVTITEPDDIPAPVVQNQSFCKSMNPKVSDLIATGSQVKWYKDGLGGNPLHPTEVLRSGNYYATQTVNGCETVVRATALVTVNNTAAPTGQSVQAFCSPMVPTLSQLQLSGSNIKWYSSATGGNELLATAVLSNGGTYYASQILNGCESEVRYPVKVMIFNNTPISTTQLTICDAVSVQDISLDGFSANQLKWYTALSGGQELSKTQSIISGTYYVSSYTNNLCESDRKAIQIVVGTKLPTPSVNAQKFCGSGTVADLVAGSVPGAKINWYSSTQSTTPLAGDTPLLTGNYYVEQELGPCKSGRVAVAVRVISVTAPAMNNFKLCESATVGDLYLAGSTNLKYVWFQDAISAAQLPDDFQLTNGYYYVAVDTDGCLSDRTKVQVTIYNRPYAPTGNLIQSFNYEAKVSDLKMNEPDILWFNSYEDALNKVNTLTGTTPLNDGQSYYGVVIDSNGCPSYATKVEVRITLGINKLDEKYLRYYPNPVNQELTISYKETIKAIEIYSVLGQLVEKQSFESTEVKVDCSRLSAGTYMFHILTDGSSQFIKVVKK